MGEKGKKQFMENMFKWWVQKLRGIILINFRLIKSRFYYVRDQTLQIQWFLDFWDLCKPLFIDFITLFIDKLVTWYLGIIIKIIFGWLTLLSAN